MPRASLPAWMALSLFVFLSPAAAQQPTGADGKVTVKAVKYTEMGSIIKDQKGKVIVVDVWALGCPPCLREFPHLVELHEKYAASGVVAVSVNVDDPGNKDAMDKVLKFLQSRHATFTNLVLDEKPEVWQEKLEIASLPCVFVFGRDGKVAKKYNDDVDYEKIQELVLELLKQR